VPVVVADPELMRRAAAPFDGVRVVEVGEDLSVPPARPGLLPVLPLPLAARERPGEPDPANGPYVLATLEAAVAACLDGRAAGLVTGPVQKSSIAAGAPDFRGHTEWLAARTGTETVVMLLVAGDLRVALATTHIPLAQVPSAITPGLLARTLDVLHQDLVRKFRIERPRILVAGLNPHAGEGGLLGSEDEAVVGPACVAARARGLDVHGPLPADTLFLPERLRGAHAVLALYHDQGLPVLKHVGFDRAVNVTLGLPIVRTSVDHGTALDLAGTGRADPGSLRAAIRLGAELAARDPAPEGAELRERRA
jgi:4-hydroxythreonine-4-phosphate dehydrogenase